MTTLLVSLILVTGSFQQSVSPDSLSLQYCYEQAYENYPVARNIKLQKKITELNVAIANSRYYPQLSVSGEATYQSEVTKVPLPNMEGPPSVSKDQYEASVNATQTIFNGGAVGIRKQLRKAQGRKKINSTKVELHQIRMQVNKVYYGILLSRQQLKTIALSIERLEKQLQTARSRVENGALLASQQYVLEAELINARQDSVTTHANLEAGYEALSELIGKKVPVSTELILPGVQINYHRFQPRRPRYDLLESTRNVLEQQQELQTAQKWPRLSAFGTAAYGRPGLNFLNDDFHGYYIVGLRLQWNFWDFINSDRKAQTLQIQQQQIVQNRRAFTLQLQTEINRIREKIEALQKKIEQDRKIVNLRRKIVEASSSQLKYGVITASDYVTELTRLSRAQLSKFVHRVQLSQAKIDYMTTRGIPLQK